MGWWDNAWSWVKDKAKKVGDWVGGAARKVGDFVKKIDFSKVGDVAGAIRKGANWVANLGIPVISTGARWIGRGAGLAENLASKGAKVAPRIIEGSAAIGNLGDQVGAFGREGISAIPKVIGAGKSVGAAFGRGLPRAKYERM